jgi:hypothetical protein
VTRQANPTRTTGPLHFEDLEPHRFEDLIRRLIYDFRPWRQLEATGRSGSDDGFDARGFEIVSGAAAAEDSDGDPEEETIAQDRVWLIQCKREKSINPKRLGQYLNAISADVAANCMELFLQLHVSSQKPRAIYSERGHKRWDSPRPICGVRAS